GSATSRSAYSLPTRAPSSSLPCAPRGVCLEGVARERSKSPHLRTNTRIPNTMRAIIPVAGFGSRMRPHTHTQPKVLLQVAGKPMLDHIIDDLRAAGVDGVTLVVGYLDDRIEEHVRKHHSDLTLN